MTDELLPTPTADQPGGTAEQHLARKARMPDGAKRTSVTDLRMKLEELTSACSQGSEGLTSPPKPTDTPASDRSSGTPIAPASSSDGGRLFPVGEMSPRSALLPTPTANDLASGMTPERWDEWTDEMRERHRNGNGHGKNLGVEAKRLTSSAAVSPASQQAPQDAGGVAGMTAGSGPSSPELLASLNRDSSSSRTSPASHRYAPSLRPPLTDAYAAGLIDGEGCIGVRTEKRTDTYRPCVEVGMSAKALDLLEEMHAHYGGTLTQTRPATDSWEAAWRWGIYSLTEVREFLVSIGPSLRLKSDQCATALTLLTLIDELPKAKNGHARWTTEARSRGRSLWMLMKELNQKGPTTTTEAAWFARYVGGEWLIPQSDLFSPTGWAKFSGTWPTSGMTRRGVASALPTSALPTDANGCSYLHTPTTGDTAPTYDHRASPGYTRAKPVPNLAAQIEDELLPTPVSDHSRGLAQPGTDYQSLPNAVLSLTEEPE